MAKIWELIRNDHRTVEKLFERLDAAATAAERDDLFGQVQHALKLHAWAEEGALYPELKRHAETSREVDEAVFDHAEMTQLADEIATTAINHPDFIRKCRELQLIVKRHIRDEEDRLLPAAEAAIDGARVAQITRQFEAEKQIAET